MDQKGTGKLVGTAIAGAICGAVFVYFVMRPSGDVNVQVSGVPGGAAKVTVAGGPAANAGAQKVTGPGAAKAPEVAARKPVIDDRVILSETPVEVRQSLVPGPVEAIPWDPNEPNEFGSLPKDDVRQRILKQEKVMQDLSMGRIECLRKIEELKNKNDKENAEIVALRKDYEAKREQLDKIMQALPGVAGLSQKGVDLKAEADTLARRRQTIAKTITSLTVENSATGQKTPKTPEAAAQVEALNKEMVEVSKRIEEDQDEILKTMVAGNNIKREAQLNNPDIKALTAQCIEKQHLLEAKRGLTPDVLEWRKKLQDYDKQFEQAAKVNVMLHKALMVPVASGGSAQSGS